MFDEVFLHRELNLGPRKATNSTNNLLFCTNRHHLKGQFPQKTQNEPQNGK